MSSAHFISTDFVRKFTGFAEKNWSMTLDWRETTSEYLQSLNEYRQSLNVKAWTTTSEMTRDFLVLLN